MKKFKVEKLEKVNQPIIPFLIAGAIILVGGGAGVATGYYLNK